MSIELLWIIPIVAFSFFIFLLIYNVSKNQDNPYKELSREVARFNTGMHHPVQQLQITPEKRLDELEKAILSVNESIANQQKLMDRVNLESTSNNSEIEDLRKKLHELQNEYDIVSSENYSLRAKIKFLMENKMAVEDSAEGEVTKNAPVQNNKGKINLKLYEDTRLMSLSQLENNEEKEKLNLG
jgi:predicted  nucleic acid-binding Zn-ribbon protein